MMSSRSLMAIVAAALVANVGMAAPAAAVVHDLSLEADFVEGGTAHGYHEDIILVRVELRGISDRVEVAFRGGYAGDDPRDLPDGARWTIEIDASDAPPGTWPVTARAANTGCVRGGEPCPDVEATTEVRVSRSPGLTVHEPEHGSRVDGAVSAPRHLRAGAPGRHDLRRLEGPRGSRRSR